MRTAAYRQAKCTGCKRLVRVRSNGKLAPHKILPNTGSKRPIPDCKVKESGLSDRRAAKFTPAVKAAAIAKGGR